MIGVQLFLDDNVRNVAAGKAMGLKTVLVSLLRRQIMTGTTCFVFCVFLIALLSFLFATCPFIYSRL